jgi:LmbE family N-acetylglucosaminyl deacetylase
MSAEQRDGFAHLPVESVAEELVELLDRHHADVLLGYDYNGGYGHPDHLQVHRAARQAAEMRPAVRLLEATVDRVALMRALRLASRLRLAPPSFSAEVFRHAYSDPADIAYVADVRRFARVKRAAMAAHRSQATGGADQRTLDYCRRLPTPVFRLVFGKEWFVDPQRSGELILPDLLGHSSSARSRFRSRG